MPPIPAGAQGRWTHHHGATSPSGLALGGTPLGLGASKAAAALASSGLRMASPVWRWRPRRGRIPGAGPADGGSPSAAGCRPPRSLPGGEIPTRKAAGLDAGEGSQLAPRIGRPIAIRFPEDHHGLGRQRHGPEAGCRVRWMAGRAGGQGRGATKDPTAARIRCSSCRSRSSSATWARRGQLGPAGWRSAGSLRSRRRQGPPRGSCDQGKEAGSQGLVRPAAAGRRGRSPRRWCRSPRSGVPLDAMKERGLRSRDGTRVLDTRPFTQPRRGRPLVNPTSGSTCTGAAR
jgi:hypothetical protein